MQIHQLLRDRQAQPRSAVLAAYAAIGLREFVEDREQPVGWNSGPVSCTAIRSKNSPCRALGRPSSPTPNLFGEFDGIADRLERIWRMRSGSPSIGRYSGATSSASSIRFCAALG